MADRTQPRRRGYRRNYQACEACKKQKGRCDLGSPDNPQPPCTRCRRARKECVFGPSRFASRGNTSNSTSPAAQAGGSSNTAQPGLPSLIGAQEATERIQPLENLSSAHGSSSVGVAAAASPVSRVYTSTNSANRETVMPQPSNQDSGHLRNHLMKSSITNPTDAMSLLSHTARISANNAEHHPYHTPRHDDDVYCRDMLSLNSRGRPSEYPATMQDNPRGDDQTFETWMHFRMCKDKLLSPNEALFLMNFFFEHMNTLCPILSDYYHDPKNHLELLREEPTLCCTIICIATRFTRLPGHASLSRGMMIHQSLFRHIQACISRVIWGIGEEEIGLGRTIGFIESLLICISWHPRALQMILEFSDSAPPTDFETAGHGKHFFETSVRGIHAHVITRLCRQCNRMSWMLVGVAASLAHEMGLFEPNSTPSRVCTAEEERKLRVKKMLLFSSVEAHFRLGKGATMQQPFGLSFDIQPPNTSIELDDKRSFIHHTLDCGVEIAQLLQQATTALYQSPAHTKNMIVTKKYLGAVAHFDTLFQNWWNKQLSVPSPAQSFTTQVEIMYHGFRSYIHLIAVQAIMERSLPLSYQNARPDQERTFDDANIAEVMNMPETARDLELIKVIASGCRRIMEIVVELHRTDSFRNSTDPVRQHVISAVIFTLKIAGLNTEPKPDMIILLKEVVHIIEVSAIDDIDLGPIYADTLRTLIAKVDNAPPARANPCPSTSTDRMPIYRQQNVSNSYPRTVGLTSPSNDTTTMPGASSRSTASVAPASSLSAPLPAMATAAYYPSASFGNGGNGLPTGFADSVPMDTDVGGAPADWGQWLAFQFDPSFSAFEMGYLVDTTNPFS